MGGPDFSIDSQFREAGWQDALASRRIEPVAPLRGDWSARSGYEVGRRLAQDRAMTAVYVANDQMATGVIAALRDAGLRVPEDVSVVGVDDSLDPMVPHNELTTVRFD
ncbi:MAG: substrate-binding domain-containing protein, partial [Collinsella intestinalis]